MRVHHTPLNPNTVQEIWVFLSQHHTIALDVDGTLVFWGAPDPGICHPGARCQVNNELVNLVKEWKAQRSERQLIIWSGAGREHARDVAAYIGLEHFADAILNKPTCVFDDHTDWFHTSSNMIKVDYPSEPV